MLCVCLPCPAGPRLPVAPHRRSTGQERLQPAAAVGEAAALRPPVQLLSAVPGSHLCSAGAAERVGLP